VASWIKLLVIMHVDKIDATKGKQSFFDKVLSFDLSILFFEIYTEGHLITNHQKRHPNQSPKWIQRTMKKPFLILQRVNFYFQNTLQSKDYIF
jgi:hypothetical protein